MYDGEMFCTKEVGTTTSQKLDEVYDEVYDVTQTAEKSWFIIVVEIICMIIVFGCLSGLLRAEATLKEALSNAPLVFVIAGLAAIVWLLIFMSQKKKVDQSLKDNHMMETLENMEEEAAQELGIPKDCRKVDVFADIYEIKKQKKKAVHEPMVMNYCMSLYVKESRICLADTKQEFSFPIEEITKIEKSKKRQNIVNWNKEESYKSKCYKKYKIAENNYGLLVKGYYSIQIASVWGEFEIRMPNYEEEAVRYIEELTGKSVLE